MAPPRDPELDQPDAPRAVDAPGIGPTLRRSRRWAVTLTVVALALFVGVVTIAWPVLHHHYERTQEHLDRYRKARFPSCTAYGTLVMIRKPGHEGDVTVRLAYFPAFAADVLWRLSSSAMAPGPVVAELVGDRTGAVIRWKGSPIERIAHAVPLDAPRQLLLRQWVRRRDQIALQVDGSVYMSTNNDAFSSALEDVSLPESATLRTGSEGAAVITLDSSVRAGLVVAGSATAWPELADRV